jgi:DNA-binding transcriptional regulator YhcF (GntR family)
MRFQISFTAGKPVYLQIVDQVRTAAASGALRTGEPLPGIRPLAEELRVNRNTVAKAYAELESRYVRQPRLDDSRVAPQPAAVDGRAARRRVVCAAV